MFVGVVLVGVGVAGNNPPPGRRDAVSSLSIFGTNAFGLIGASQLEASTVDLSTEFTGLITTQRAYSASSKIITTADEMLATSGQLKQ